MPDPELPDPELPDPELPVPDEPEDPVPDEPEPVDPEVPDDPMPEEPVVPELPDDPMPEEPEGLVPDVSAPVLAPEEGDWRLQPLANTALNRMVTSAILEVLATVFIEDSFK